MSLPEYHDQEEFQIRLKKLEEIKLLHVDPYPHHYAPTHTTKDILEKYKEEPIGNSEDALSNKTPSVKIAGRLMLFRAMGKNAFAHLQDETGRLQFMCNREQTIVEGYDPAKSQEALSHIKFIEKKIDLGDILGIEGNLFRTHTGEITLFAKKVTLLCKSLLPLPDKHSGLVDQEIRYRKRWLDLISNPESRQRFIKRSKMVKIIRQFLDQQGFMEVETPILQTTYGGAEAKPFKTHLLSLHQEMFLRISLETTLKKLMVGGFQKIYEIGKVFRNEGIDKSHNPEFTLLEAYSAYWDYNDVLHFVESLMEKIALELLGTCEVPFPTSDGGVQIINLRPPWTRMTMKESLRTYANIDVDSLNDQEMRHLLIREAKVEEKLLKESTRGILIAQLFDEFVSRKLILPHHITDHPIETTPLCKLHRNEGSKKEQLVERFESFINGCEICNAYSELNDPLLQRKLLTKQAETKVEKEEAPPLEEEFIEAICQGMPPTGGLGIGIDRLAIIFTEAKSIREVLYFPLMKPEES
jgi:lysyl-tRNA synthetase, class II